MARKTCLDVSLCTIGGYAFLGRFRTFAHDFDLQTQEAKAINQRYDHAQIVKRKNRFSIDALQDVDANNRASHLDVTVFSYNAASRLGELNSFTLTYTTKTSNGKGVGTLDEEPQALGTGLELQAEEFVATVADLAVLGIQTAKASIASLDIVVVCTVNGISYPMTGVLSAGSIKVGVEEIQMQNVTIKLKAAIAAPTGSATLFALIATGSAAVAFTYNLGSIGGQGNAVITKAALAVRDADLVQESYDFDSFGLETTYP